MNKQILSAILASAVLAVGCSKQAPEPKAAAPSPSAAPEAQVTELQKTDLVQGTGEGISAGQQAVVHYTGWLYEPGQEDNKGKQFDSSRESGRPFRFVIGAGGVIKGWEEGVQGMQVGGQRRLVIPASLGYGERGAGDGVIPPNATLVFDIELLAIESPPSP